MSVATAQRFKPSHRCPICEGCDSDPRGKGKRCSGFISSDGMYAHCSREEHAGGLEQEGGGTYAHRMRGTCRCGVQHGPDDVIQLHPTVTYDYPDAHGVVLSRVVRGPVRDGKKTFYQQHPDGNGGWVKGRGNAPRVLYRLPELIAADPSAPVFIVEGEKDVDTARALGLAATCNPEGAGKWHYVVDLARDVLRGRDVVVLADADEPGREHARQVRASLEGYARSVRVIEAPSPNKDLTDWITAGGKVADVLSLAQAANDIEPNITSPWAGRIVVPKAECYTRPPPKREYLLSDARTGSGVLPQGRAGMALAPGGGSKTTTLAQLAIATTTGTRWLGAFSVEKPGRVLLALGEEDADEAVRKLYFARGAANAPVPPDGSIIPLALQGLPCPMIERDANGNPIDAPFLTWLRGYVTTIPDLRLIVLDPFSRFAGLDAEKDNALATRAVEALESLCVATGATVLVGHHTAQWSRTSSQSTPEARAASARGVTALTDGLRWAASLSTEYLEDISDDLKEIVTLAHAKNNYGPRWEPIACRRSPEHGGALVPLDPVEMEMLAAARQATAPAARRESAKAERAAARIADADATVVAVVREYGGIVTRELRAAVEARARIGHDAAKSAIERVVLRGRIRRDVDGRSQRHFIAEDSTNE